jgi:hypothetical protein
MSGVVYFHHAVFRPTRTVCVETAKITAVSAVLGLIFLCHTCKCVIGLELVLGVKLKVTNVNRFSITWIVVETVERHRESRFGPEDNLPARRPFAFHGNAKLT